MVLFTKFYGSSNKKFQCYCMSYLMSVCVCVCSGGCVCELPQAYWNFVSGTVEDAYILYVNMKMFTNHRMEFVW